MKKGFTLIELLIVIALISIILTLSVPISIKIMNQNTDKLLNLQKKEIENAAMLYLEDYCKSPVENKTCPLNPIADNRGVIRYSGTINISNLINNKYIKEAKLGNKTCTGTVIFTSSVPTVNLNCTTDSALGYNKILKDNPHPKVRTDFNTTVEDEQGLYVENRDGYTQENGKPVYYFAGNVTNNYLNFANLYWRIVRINEDNSIRLIYAGPSTGVTTTSGYIYENGALKPTYFNSSRYGTYHVGYKYTVGEQHGNTTDSVIKNQLDNWYISNINKSIPDSATIKYSDYVSKTAIYCNDRDVAPGATWAVGGNEFYYATYDRLVTNKNPTFKCNTLEDQFTGTNTSNIGNQELGSKPIALLTADEVVYAGGKSESNNQTYYLYNNAQSQYSWWTMSPSRWAGNESTPNSITSNKSFNVTTLQRTLNSNIIVPCVAEPDDDGANMFYLNNQGGLNYFNFGYSVIGNYGIRPVLSLKSCVNINGGNGTFNNPYTLETIDTSCINSDN